VRSANVDTVTAWDRKSAATADWPAALGVILTAAIAAVWLQFPGAVPYDGITVWYEARHAVHFSQHPPAMALVLHYFDRLLPGPGLYTAFQVILLWLAAAIVIAWQKPPMILAVPFCALLFFHPFIFAMEGRLVKDILSSHLALLACLLVTKPGDEKTSTATWMTAFALTAIATLIRYQFIAVAAVLGVWLLWRLRGESQRRIATLGALCLAGFAGTTLLFSVWIGAAITNQTSPNLDRNIGANDFERSVRKIYIYDIAGVVANDPSAQLTKLTPLVDVDQIKKAVHEAYTPALVDPLWAPGGLFEKLAGVPEDTIQAQWAVSMVSSPGAFLRHRFNAFARVLGFGSLYDCFPIVAGMWNAPQKLAAELDVRSYRPALATGILRSSRYPVWPLFYPFIYAALGILLIGLYLGGANVPAGAACVALTGLVYEATFFVLPQACGLRYSYYMVVTSLFAVGMTIFHRRRSATAGSAAKAR
jgi:hypothetical protein